MGSKATTASGMASKTHQLIINTATDKTRLALNTKAKGFMKKKKRHKSSPANMANSFWCFLMY